MRTAESIWHSKMNFLSDDFDDVYDAMKLYAKQAIEAAAEICNENSKLEVPTYKEEILSLIDELK